MKDTSQSPMNVLLIEDSIHDQIAFRRALDRSHSPFALTVHEQAEDIPAAMQAGSNTYDIVVVDYDLPGINGLQAFERLRQQTDLPPFIMLTGVGSEDLAVKALKAGIADYLVKDPNEGYLNLLPLKLRAVRRQYEDRRARQNAQAELKKAHAELEQLVNRRTAELYRTVQTLREEIAEREKSEYALRRSKEALRNLSRQITGAQEYERRLIAKELHDSIGSSLVAIKFAVEGKLESMQGESPSNIVSLELIVQFIRETIEELRRISNNLRPAALDDLGLLPAMTALCRNNQAIYRDVRFDCRLDVDEDDVAESAKVVFYRIMQEALNNALRHSQADTVTITLEKTARDTVRLCVADNGRGMDPDKPNGNAGMDPAALNGFGLQAMRDRAEVIGASLAIDSAPATGTRVCLTLPAPTESTS
ncbi:MAG TPA: response regulator [Desulfosarcina sp.]|nr:response regulator [Desulfosarcina sp.]